MKKHIDEIQDWEISNTQLVLENELIRMIFHPEFGGKLTDLISKKSGTQFLSKSNVDLKTMSTPGYGSMYKPPYASGFDECFPTIAKCLYPLNGKLISLPDHGELWTQPWDCKTYEDHITMKVAGVSLDYEFCKRISLKDNRIQIDYQVKNNETYPIDFIWSSHPLLQVKPDDEILLSSGIDNVKLNWTSDSNIGKQGDLLAWPMLDAKNPLIEYSKIQVRSHELALKLFTPKLSHGVAGFYKKKEDETLLFRFNTDELPYLGIWLCYGAWPDNTAETAYTIALEPTNCCYDTLSEAIGDNCAQRIPPLGTADWSLMLEIIPGKYLLE